VLRKYALLTGLSLLVCLLFSGTLAHAYTLDQTQATQSLEYRISAVTNEGFTIQ